LTDSLYKDAKRRQQQSEERRKKSYSLIVQKEQVTPREQKRKSNLMLSKLAKELDQSCYIAGISPEEMLQQSHLSVIMNYMGYVNDP